MTLRRRLRSRLLSAVFRGLTAVLGRLSWSRAQAVGRRLGGLAWHLARRDRRRTLEHLSIAFPDATPEERRRLARAAFLHQGTLLSECLWLFRASPEDLERHVELEGWEEVEAARAAGRPILIVTGHCGNWELLAALLNSRGLGMRVVARELDAPQLDRLLVGLRDRFGTETISRGAPGAARQLLATLREGGALGMLIDQDTKVDGVWVPFFGRPANTPVGAAKVALRQKMAVLPTFIERREDGRHLARIHPPLDLPDDAVETTARMTEAIEAQIRRRPEQWVWMHRRWRRRPPSSPC